MSGENKNESEVKQNENDALALILILFCGVGGVYLDSAKASLDINFSPLIKII